MESRDESNRGNRPRPSSTTSTASSFDKIGRERDIEGHFSDDDSSTRRRNATSPQEAGWFDGYELEETGNAQSSSNGKQQDVAAEQESQLTSSFDDKDCEFMEDADVTNGNNTSSQGTWVKIGKPPVSNKRTREDDGEKGSWMDDKPWHVVDGK